MTLNSMALNLMQGKFKKLSSEPHKRIDSFWVLKQSCLGKDAWIIMDFINVLNKFNAFSTLHKRHLIIFFMNVNWGPIMSLKITVLIKWH